MIKKVVCATAAAHNGCFDSRKKILPLPTMSRATTTTTRMGIATQARHDRTAERYGEARVRGPLQQELGSVQHSAQRYRQGHLRLVRQKKRCTRPLDTRDACHTRVCFSVTAVSFTFTCMLVVERAVSLRVMGGRVDRYHVRAKSCEFDSTLHACGAPLKWEREQHCEVCLCVFCFFFLTPGVGCAISSTPWAHTDIL